MKVKRLHLQNYGRFEDLKIDFAPTAEKTGNVTVIVGNNGAGKSQILQALATTLSWFIVRLKENNAEGKYLTQLIIRNNSSRSIIETEIEDLGAIENEGSWEKSSMLASWKIGVWKEKKLQPALHDFQISNLHHIVDRYRLTFMENQDASLPILAFYPVDRSVKSTPMETNENSISNQLSAYDNTLENSVSFESFFLWFREREDIENEGVAFSRNNFEEETVKKLIESSVKKIIDKEVDSLLKNKEFKSEFISLLSKQISKLEKEYPKILASMIHDKQLQIVKLAIKVFTGLDNPVVRRQGTPTMIVEKNGEELDVNQLSQGEKSLFALVGDIARRLALLNPSLDNPLEGEGVVMIDEVDLHLHPKWQHDLIDKLVNTFPNVQFILTTHSPHVISDRNDILLYSLDDGELTEMPNVYGEDANTVLTKIFDVDIRDSKVEEQFIVIRRAISKHDYLTAENGITELAEKLPSEHLELLKCRLLLAQAKLAKSNKDESSYAED